VLRKQIYQLFRKKMIYKLKRFALDSNDHVANQRGGISDEDSEKIVCDVIQKLNAKPGEIILEIGCGIGIIGRRLSEMGISYIGMDIIFELIKRANFKRSSLMSFFQGDAQKMPFSEASFDRVILYGVILYLPPEIFEQILLEIKKILKPGGILLIGDVPNPRNVKKFLGRYHANKDVEKSFSKFKLAAFLMKKKIQRIFNLPGGGWYTPDQLMSILDQHSFNGEIIRQNQSLPFGHYRYDCIASIKGEKSL
jgi:ubiquinone/menaquinone biosynthesis C-methylase UbiE